MPLSSLQFKGNKRLEDCLISHEAHVVPGSRGEHVKLIQQALVILGAGTVAQSEIRDGFFGPTTVQCVANFKGPPRNIINKAYQSAPDNIVGKMTIERLDVEMLAFENRPPLPPVLFSLYVAVSEAGEVHDHERCPTRPYVTSPGRDGRAQHLASPIFPKGLGGKVNIWGEGETDYLGFKDYATHRGRGTVLPMRPLTRAIDAHTVSDICIRSSPIHRITGTEIQRIARQGCRFTYASNSGFVSTRVRQFIASMGSIVEKLKIPDGTDHMEVFVVECDITANWRFDLLDLHTA